MARSLALLALFLTACDGAPERAETDAIGPPARSAERAAPTPTPVPTPAAVPARIGPMLVLEPVDTGECAAHGPGALGLPAISGDGGFVAVGHVDLDGGRGNPNFALVVHEARGDRVAYHKTILEPDEVVGVDCSILRARVERRMREANEWLAVRRWRSLAELSVEGDRETRARASLDGLGAIDVRYREPRLSVAVARQTVLERAAREWSAPRGPRCPGCEDCAPRAKIGRAWVDASTRTLVLAIEYAAGDLCDTDGQEHVVRFGAR